MQESKRIRDLYNRPLVKPELSGRHLPLQHLLTREFESHPKLLDPEQFDILEIGPGRGDFLVHLASTNPHKKILGIEIGKPRFEKLVKRRDLMQLKNLWLIHSDARIPLMTTLSKMKLEKIFVLFPDPWPRNRHSYKRLLTLDFLKILCGLLKSGGEFTLATDVEDYARWVLNHFADITEMAPVQAGTEVLPDLIPTYFEQKWQSRGRVCRYVRFVKR